MENKLGTHTNPIVNTAILGAYARAVGNVSIDSVTEAIMEMSPAKKEANVVAAKAAYEKVVGV